MSSSMFFELERIEYKDAVIRIVQDEDAQEPDWGGEGAFLTRTRKGTPGGLGQDEGMRARDASCHLKWGEGLWGEYGQDIPNWGLHLAWELYQEWLDQYDPTYTVWPYWAGNVHGPGSFEIQVLDFAEDNLCHERAAGWIYVLNPGTPVEQLANPEFSVEEVRDGLINVYQEWANGNVQRYEILDKDGVELESCGGFYGFGSAMKEGKVVVDGLADAVRPVKFVVLLGKTSTWEYKTLNVPLLIAASAAPAWALGGELAAQEDILGVMLACHLLTQSGLAPRKAVTP